MSEDPAISVDQPNPEIVTLRKRLHDYEHVVADLLRQMGGRAEITTIKRDRLTGRILGPLPLITAYTRAEGDTFTLSIAEDPVTDGEPVLGVATEMVEDVDRELIALGAASAIDRGVSHPEMTFREAVEFLEGMADDWKADGLDGEPLDSIIALIKKDRCLYKLAPGEPYFLLRAQDSLAPWVVNTWLHRTVSQGAKLDPGRREEVETIINAMVAWPHRRLPT